MTIFKMEAAVMISSSETRVQIISMAEQTTIT
jgi:hypothetical protein